MTLFVWIIYFLFVTLIKIGQVKVVTNSDKLINPRTPISWLQFSLYELPSYGLNVWKHNSRFHYKFSLTLEHSVKLHEKPIPSKNFVFDLIWFQYCNGTYNVQLHIIYVIWRGSRGQIIGFLLIHWHKPRPPETKRSCKCNYEWFYVGYPGQCFWFSNTTELAWVQTCLFWNTSIMMMLQGNILSF